MLPGLRILFAITLLSVSVLIFGLGAAAFLRSAHEDFASAPWRPIETPATARVDLAPATLAMLRVEPETTLHADLPAAITAPRDAKMPADTSIAAPAAADTQSPRAEQVEATTKSTPPEPAPVSAPPMQTDAPQGAQESSVAKTPAETPARDASVAPAVGEAKTAEAKTAETKEPQGAPTIVAALGPEKAEAPAKIASEPAPAAVAPSPVAETPPSAATPAATAPGNDTLKADDKSIDAAPAAKIAALAEPALAEVAPLPAKDVKIPNPRVDPAVLQASRLRMLSQQRARRAAKARRLAAARARIAAQAKAPQPSDPFGTPANTTATRSR
jgi:hypothetical protein